MSGLPDTWTVGVGLLDVRYAVAHHQHVSSVRLLEIPLPNPRQLRIIADDVDTARTALKEANITFEESELATVLLENQAGELANVADKLNNAGLNLQAVYVIGLDGDLVELAIACSDVKKAKKALE